MKVRIVKSDRDSYWYSKKIGKIFDVWENESCYEVKKVNPKETTLFIEKDDCEIIPETEYTYLDIDLPEWWDGRPIYGKAWGRVDGTEKHKAYCFGIDPNPGMYKYVCRSIDLDTYCWYKNFEPIPKQQTSAKVVITKDGKSREVKLTDEQIKKLGI